MRVLTRLLTTVAAFAVSTAANAAALPPYDQLFLRNEARGSAYELAIAKLAQARASRADVKAYAATLVHDHEGYDAALRELAAKRGLRLPSGLTAQGREAMDRLATLDSTAFDRAFVAEARRVNAADMLAFRREAARTADVDIANFVAGFLPVEEQHEAGARALAGTQVASRMPIIKPPVAGSAMPVIPPPDAGSAMPVIKPKP